MFVPPERRRIGMVFQDVALFPHLSVGENVAFGIQRAPDRAARVAELLDLVGLPDAGGDAPARAVGGHAAARGARPGAGAPPRRGPAGRAVREPRPRAADAAPGRAATRARRDRRRGAARDPRPGGGAHGRRPGRGDAPRRRGPGRHARGDLRPAGHAVRRDLRRRGEPRCRRRRSGTAPRRSSDRVGLSVPPAGSAGTCSSLVRPEHVELEPRVEGRDAGRGRIVGRRFAGAELHYEVAARRRASACGSRPGLPRGSWRSATRSASRSAPSRRSRSPVEPALGLTSPGARRLRVRRQPAGYASRRIDHLSVTKGHGPPGTPPPRSSTSSARTTRPTHARHAPLAGRPAVARPPQRPVRRSRPTGPLPMRVLAEAWTSARRAPPASWTAWSSAASWSASATTRTAASSGSRSPTRAATLIAGMAAERREHLARILDELTDDELGGVPRRRPGDAPRPASASTHGRPPPATPPDSPATDHAGDRP